MCAMKPLWGQGKHAVGLQGQVVVLCGCDQSYLAFPRTSLQEGFPVDYIVQMQHNQADPSQESLCCTGHW